MLSLTRAPRDSSQFENRADLIDLLIRPRPRLAHNLAGSRNRVLRQMTEQNLLMDRQILHDALNCEALVQMILVMRGIDAIFHSAIKRQCNKLLPPAPRQPGCCLFSDNTADVSGRLPSIRIIMLHPAQVLAKQIMGKVVDFVPTQVSGTDQLSCAAADIRESTLVKRGQHRGIRICRRGATRPISVLSSAG